MDGRQGEEGGVSGARRRGRGRGMAATDIGSADVAAWGVEGCRRGPRPQDDHGLACIGAAAQDGRMGCRHGRGRTCGWL